MIARTGTSRIAYVSAVGATGGGERVLMELARGAIESGCSAEIFCLRDGAWAQGAWGTDVKIHSLSSGYRIRYPWSVLRAARWLRQRLAEYRPTLIHANHASWWITAWAARRCHASTLWHLHDFPDQRDLPTQVGVRFPPTGTLFTTQHVASGFPELRRSEHAVISPVTIDVATFCTAGRDDRILEAHGLEAQRYFLTVCRWQPHKGLHDLVAAVAQRVGEQMQTHRTLHVILGKPTNDVEERYYESVLDQMSRQGVCDQFILISECSDDQLRALYFGSMALVHPAHSEGFGLVLLEAMSLGVPVIACDAAGPKEILSSPDVGILVPRGCPSSLCRAMRLILDDPQQREKIGAAGAQRASQLSRGEMIRQTMAFYDMLQPSS